MNKLDNKEDTNDVLSVQIEEVNINGEGISFLDDKKICLEDVLSGETVVAQKQFEKDSFIRAKVLDVTKTCPMRIAPPCPYYEACGGCNLQIVGYKDSIMLKKDIIKKYFSKFYSGDIKFFESKKFFNYRNKISFYVDKNKLGLLEKNSNKIVEINSCMIADKNINNLIPTLKKFLLDFNREGIIKNIVVRILNNQMIIAFVVKKFFKDKFLLSLDLFKDFANKNNIQIGLYQNIASQKKEILSDKWSHIWGIKKIKATIFDIEFLLHPHSFFQVNFDVMCELYKNVAKKICNEDVIEGYSGIGLLSAVLSKSAKQLFSVEINKNAVLDARGLLVQNKINNVKVFCGDCKNMLPILIEKHPQSTFLIDPPRSGCDKETLKSLIDNKVQKIVYISCAPYTLKQNIGYLSEFYQVESLDLFDMFPQTYHIESLCVLKRK